MKCLPLAVNPGIVKLSDRRNPYYYPFSEWDRKRSRAWRKAQAQAKFRGEIFELTYEDWCKFYPDEESVNLRGRNYHSWCLTRYDPEGPWDTKNTCSLPRLTILKIKNRRMKNLPVEHLFEGAEYV